MVERKLIKCERCDYEWLSRQRRDRPICPSCSQAAVKAKRFENSCLACGQPFESLKQSPKQCPLCKSRKWREGLTSRIKEGQTFLHANNEEDDERADRPADREMAAETQTTGSLLPAMEDRTTREE